MREKFEVTVWRHIFPADFLFPANHSDFSYPLAHGENCFGIFQLTFWLFQEPTFSYKDCLTRGQKILLIPDPQNLSIVDQKLKLMKVTEEQHRNQFQLPFVSLIFHTKITNFSQSSLFFASVPSATNHHTMLGRLASVLDSFSIVCSKASFDPLKANYLVANHLRTSPLQKSTLISLSTMIAKMMTEFAMSQFLFMSLDSSDRVI